jgi:integrase
LPRKLAASRKPTTRQDKPHPDFPLYPHKVGRWAKKVKGSTVYFTNWVDDPKGVKALEQWLDQKDDLLVGRVPRAKSDQDALTVGDLCNQFLADKGSLRDNGELSPRTFQGYYATCDGIVKALGRNRAVSDLVPDDFRKLKDKLAKTRKLVALGNEIIRVRSVFKFAFDEGLILAPVRFGRAFGKPKQERIDAQRNAHRQEHGPRMFEADELRLILDALAGQEVTTKQVDEKTKQPIKATLTVNPALRAMVLLGINCGFGQTDCASLPQTAVDLDGGWIDFARVKTAVGRRIPLWPETVVAIREWLPKRPPAKEPADSRLVFLTCHGAKWVKLNATGSPDDEVGKEFRKVLDKLGLTRSQRSFYALRHGFETVAGETVDQVVVDLIMGHKIKDMKRNYIERIGDDRLRRAVDHVRAWLFPSSPSPETEGGAS